MAEAHTIHVDIVSAEGEMFSGEATMVFAPASQGDLGIAPRHAPLLTLLKAGEVRVQTPDGKEQSFFVGGGALEVQPNKVTVLADTAMRAKDLDEAAALEAKQRAEEALRDKQRAHRPGPGAGRAGARCGPAETDRAPAQDPELTASAAPQGLLRGLRRNLTSGLQLLALLRRVPADFVHSFDQVAALLLLKLLVWAGLDTLHAERGAQLMLDGLYGWAFYLLLGLFACGLVARAYRDRPRRALSSYRHSRSRPFCWRRSGS